MFTSLPTASLRLVELFDDPYHFTIPAYQRPYSWSVDEAGQLLEDLISASGVDDPDAADSDYFLGAILLLDSQPGAGMYPESPARDFSIIDGQQRLITLTTIAAALRDLDAGNAEAGATGHLAKLVQPASQASHDRYRMTLRGAEHDFFEEHVLEPGACTRMPDSDSVHSVGERRILAARERIIEQLMNLTQKERRTLSDFVCDCCHFVVIRTGDIDNAHRMFTVLNGRGKPLQKDDILKAEVLHAIPRERAAEAVAIWEQAASKLDNEFEDFFSHMRVLHGRTKPKVIAGIRSIIKEVGGSEVFIHQEFEPLSEAYHRVLSATSPTSDLSRNVRDPLVRLARFKSGADWRPAAITILRDHADDPAYAGALLLEVERLAYLVRVLCIGSNKRISRFAPVVQALRAGEVLGPESDVFKITKDENRLINYFFRDFYKRSQQGCKHLLMRINDELTGETSLLEPKQLSVEHVLPQTPSATSTWRKWYPDAESRDVCTKSLGNLTLITSRQNDRARNKEFERKKGVYETPEEGMPVLSMTAEILDQNVWNQDRILKREYQFKKILERIWRLDLGSQKTTVADGPQRSQTTAHA